jgi:hypothetical protein
MGAFTTKSAYVGLLVFGSRQHSEVHPASYPIGTDFLLEAKPAGREADYTLL